MHHRPRRFAIRLFSFPYGEGLMIKQKLLTLAERAAAHCLREADKADAKAWKLSNDANRLRREAHHHLYVARELKAEAK